MVRLDPDQRAYLYKVDLRQLPEIVLTLPLDELRHAVFRARGKWPCRSSTAEQLHEMLWHKTPVSTGPIHALRDTLVEYINEHSENLSLHCDGDCTKHPDAVVVACYMEYIDDAPQLLE
jgi:hypothetical protein